VELMPGFLAPDKVVALSLGCLAYDCPVPVFSFNSISSDMYSTPSLSY